jgi:hypothetical protein
MFRSHRQGAFLRCAGTETVIDPLRVGETTALTSEVLVFAMMGVDANVRGLGRLQFQSRRHLGAVEGPGVEAEV